MMMRATTVATLLVLALHAPREAAANKKAIKVQGFVKMCTLSKKLKTVQAYATNKLTHWRAKITALNELHEDLTILAKKSARLPDDPTITVIRLLKHEAKVLEQKYHNLAEAAPLAATVAGQAAGAMDEAASIFYAATKHGSGGKYCLEQDNAATKLAAATEISGCITEDSAPVTAAADAAAAEPRTTDITTKWAEATVAAAAGQGNNCLLTQADNNGGYLDSNEVSDGIKWAGGLLKFTTSQLSGRPWVDTSTELAAIPVLNSAKQQLEGLAARWRHTTSTIDNLLKLKEPTEQTFTDIDSNENVLNPGGTDKDLKVTKEQLEQIRKKVNNYREPLSAAGKLESSRNSFHLQDLTTNTTVTIEKVNAECNKDTQGKQSYKTKEEECNKAKDDKAECDKLEKQGCIFNNDGKKGEKCTLSDKAKDAAKEAEKQPGNDGKTNTNTTGSNSFVIDKTPLLFAFLLF
uniref:Variant surface glycoprotein 1125.54 n=1 Tax=Trypanosoma brucei TaxID=5691 RepID=A0A1J0R443_9TRYP|nr:variant surface glycoprotein 1125.54 [Trypanosoma brucei]